MCTSRPRNSWGPPRPSVPCLRTPSLPAQTAKAAGFYTVGVYEKAYAAQWAELTTLCDETVEDWSQSL